MTETKTTIKISRTGTDPLFYYINITVSRISGFPVLHYSTSLITEHQYFSLKQSREEFFNNGFYEVEL